LEHDGSQNSRELSGNNRKEMQKRLLIETPLQVERKLLAAADQDLLRCGTLDEIRTLKVLQTAKAEALVSKYGDLSQDKFTDLVCTFHVQKSLYQSSALPGLAKSKKLTRAKSILSHNYARIFFPDFCSQFQFFLFK